MLFRSPLLNHCCDLTATAPCGAPRFGCFERPTRVSSVVFFFRASFVFHVYIFGSVPLSLHLSKMTMNHYFTQVRMYPWCILGCPMLRFPFSLLPYGGQSFNRARLPKPSSDGLVSLLSLRLRDLEPARVGPVLDSVKVKLFAMRQLLPSVKRSCEL